MKVKYFVLIALVFFTTIATGQNIASSGMSIIPVPDKLALSEGCFELDSTTKIIVSDEATKQTAGMLNEFISPATGYELEFSNAKDANSKCIEFRINDELSALSSEGYKLMVTEDSILIESSGQAGLFYGIQTLRQLMPPVIYSNVPIHWVKWQVPCVEIEDKPEFKWRGMHLDVCRYFMSKEFVKKYIDLIAMHKMNIFHWHLTDDQGWRIEIKKYPKLAEISAWRNESLIGHLNAPGPHKYDGIRHGGFYTQEEIKEIVKYAKDRFVTVVPEIEMPGHAKAALAAYPNLSCAGGPFEVEKNWGVIKDVYCAGDEETFEFLQNVLTEVVQLFPSEYIHIGGDECPKDRWKVCPKCQKRIANENLKDEHELQGYFIKRMEKFLNQHGRKIIGWDEILEGGIDPSATVMSWRGEKGGIAAAKAGHDVIMAPNTYTYLDYYQGPKETEPLAIGSFVPLEKVYSYNPVPQALTEDEGKYILGAQAQLWTEYMKDAERVEYMAYPRGCALAEVVWSKKDNKDYNDFRGRLKKHFKRFDILGVNYRNLDN